MILSTVVSVGVCWLLVGFTLFLPLAQQIESPISAQEARRAASVLLYLHDRLALLGVLLFVLVLLLALRASHRIAGPLWRMRRYFDECAEGRIPERARFRRGDWIGELVPSLQRMFDSMREKRTEAPPVEPSEDRDRFDSEVARALAEPHSKSRGFTLLEIAIVCLVISVLSSIALPRYLSVVSQAKEEVVIAELKEIAEELESYYRTNGEYPEKLVPTRYDPWGNPYAYFRIALPREGMTMLEYEKKMGELKKIESQVRKDKNLHPLNTDFDLYSMGPDGKSNLPLTAKASRDDYIRANDGRFYGVAEDF